MDNAELQQVLCELRFSAGLSIQQLHQLAEISRTKDFRAGATLFAEGSVALDLYLVRSGRVELCMNVPARGCLPILTLEAGDLVGWSALVGQGEMTASAIAVEDTQLILVSADKLLELCERDREFGYQIMRRVAAAVSKRLVATRLQLLDLFSDGPQQVLGREVSTT